MNQSNLTCATILSIVLVGAGCGTAAPVAEPEPDPKSDSEPVTNEWLETPFTANEIRDVWGVGFTLTVRQASPEREWYERWTVVAADDEEVEIEYQPVDAAGGSTESATSDRAAWTELRDHARFPSATSTRERVRRDTPLGELEGWLYVVRDETAGTVTELFFADALVGAPVEMRVRQGDQVVMEMTQVSRDG